MATIPMVFSFNDDYAVPACVAIKSLVDNASRWTEYEIYVIYSQVSEKNMTLISAIHPGHIHWIKMDTTTLEEVPTSGEYPLEVYYRLAIAEMFPQWDKIIYSDVDVLFAQDLSKLFKTDLTEYYWAGVPIERNEEAHVVDGDPNVLSGHTKFQENKNSCIFASGLMVINAKKMREDHMFQKFLKVGREFSGRLKMFDLDILNIACQGTIKALPLDYCVFECLTATNDIRNTPFYPFLSRIYTDRKIKRAIRKPYIIHYTGCESTRVWNRPQKPANYARFFCMFF